MKDQYKLGTRFWWLNDESKQMLNGGYLLPNETPKDAILRIAFEASQTMDGKVPFFYEKFVEIVEKGWASLSSPVWANSGTPRGLPISCYGVNVGDNIDSIADKLSEVIRQSSYGGGTSGYFGNLRGRGQSITSGGSSTGAVSMMLPYEAVTKTFTQGDTRVASFATYIDIDHDDFEEHMNIRSVNSPFQKIMFGVCISDEWMDEMEAGDREKRNRFAKVHKNRREKGMPFIVYTGNSNQNKPDIYKMLDLYIPASNLCTEIFLPSDELESFVCCLSSMNLALYDEWKDTDAIAIMTYFLDCVMTEFIKKSEGVKHLVPARRFAERHRALGLGVLGWHTYLQSNMIEFDSLQANALTDQIFKQLQEQSKQASLDLAGWFGHAPIFDEVDEDIVKYRNTTTNAVAPTRSSSGILGQSSEGRNLIEANYYQVRTAKGTFMRKSREFEKLLISKGMDNDETWESVKLANGSCQHLDFLTDAEKRVFKTFPETNQMAIIIQASIAQKYLDQGQSIDLNIPPEVSASDVNNLYMQAWKLGVKSLYYQKSESVAKNFINEIASCAFCES